MAHLLMLWSLFSCASVNGLVGGYRLGVGRHHFRLAEADSSNNGDYDGVPRRLGDLVDGERVREGLGIATLGWGLFSARPSPVNAVGNLYEFESSPCAIQDISMNVVEAAAETKMFSAMFLDSCKPLKESIVNGRSQVTLGFGPDAYEKPKDFVYGVSSLDYYGGHATLTLTSLITDAEGVAEIVDPGNGLQYIKVGTDQLRISKGIQAGAKVEGAYGWIDVESPGGVPLKVIVGIARDPFMYACLRVQNMKESVAFFTEEMGMKVMPMPIARQAGSQYEPQQAKDAVFVSYGEDLFGLLLERSPKKAKINPGGLLSEITILADEKSEVLPQAVKTALEGDGTVQSPDGYRFKCIPYTQYKFGSMKQ